MSKFNIFLISFLFFSLNLFSTNDNEPVLLKSASTNPVDIPFEKWQFPNGLKVLIHEDNSDNNDVSESDNIDNDDEDPPNLFSDI